MILLTEFSAFYFFPVLLLLAGLLTLAISLQFIGRQIKAVNLFGLLMVGVSIWALGYGCEIFAQGLPLKMFFTTVAYLGISTLPAIWIIFCFRFTGTDGWFKPAYLMGLFIIPAITFVLIATNMFHQLYYSKLEIVKLGPLSLLTIEPGPWYKVHNTYFYLLMVYSLYILGGAYRAASRAYKEQYAIIIAGASIPWIANAAYLMGFRPFQLDLTPFSFIFSVLVVAYGIKKFRLFDLIPAGFSKAVEQMSDGLIILTNKQEVNHINKATANLFNPYHIRTGDPISSFIDNPQLLDILAEQQGGKTEITFEREQKIFYYEVSITPILDRNVINGTILIIRDITVERMAENKLHDQAQELRKLNELKNKLFSVISHDLRSPLANIQNLVMLADEGLIDKDELWGLMPQLSKQVNDTSELLDNLLSWSKMQIEGEKLFPVALDLNTFFDRTLLRFEDRAYDKGIILEKEIEPELEALCDPGSLELISRNLISNAIKFCSEGDTIRVCARAELNQVIISFVDTGTGIPDHVKEQLFSSLSISTPGTLMEQGSGFGLAISYEYAVKNAGKLSVESEMGKGSTFNLILPLPLPLTTAPIMQPGLAVMAENRV